MSTLEKSKKFLVRKKSLSNEITVNGKAYREFSKHASCFMTKSSHFILHSLLDREANGGVAGVIHELLKLMLIIRLKSVE